MSNASGNLPIDWHGLVFVSWPDTSKESLEQLLSNWNDEPEYERSRVAWSEMRVAIGEGYSTYACWQSEGWQIVCGNVQGGLREIDHFPFGAVEFIPFRDRSTGKTNGFWLDIRTPGNGYVHAVTEHGRLSLLEPWEARDWNQFRWPWLADILYSQRLPALIAWKHSWSPESGFPQRFSLDASLYTTLQNLGLPTSLWPYPDGQPTIIEAI
ncbi:MAG: hypothetical protein JWN14_138 [Chthonomonadales bacterium]|nr:hypothetical protein [Chthonomonadales bacterium]